MPPIVRAGARGSAAKCAVVPTTGTPTALARTIVCPLSATPAWDDARGAMGWSPQRQRDGAPNVHPNTERPARHTPPEPQPKTASASPSRRTTRTRPETANGGCRSQRSIHRGANGQRRRLNATVTLASLAGGFTHMPHRVRAGARGSAAQSVTLERAESRNPIAEERWGCDALGHVHESLADAAGRYLSARPLSPTSWCCRPSGTTPGSTASWCAPTSTPTTCAANGSQCRAASRTTRASSNGTARSWRWVSRRRRWIRSTGPPDGHGRRHRLHR